MDLRAMLLGALAGHATRRPYALLDYPDYLNPGDAAIWLGSLQLLARLNGSPPSYVSTLKGFSPAALKRAIGADGVVFFLGGGNFGDLYPRHQQHRLKVIAALEGHPLVFLPLSTALAATPDPALRTATRSALRRSAPTLMLAREALSRDVLGDLFGAEAVVAPDAAEMLDLSAPTETGIVRLMRGDRESAGHGIDAPDWADLPGLSARNRLGKLAFALSPMRLKVAVSAKVAAAKVAIATRHLATGRVLVTDRLHAMILGHRMGLEVVVLSAATGKAHGYLGAFGPAYPRAFAATTAGEAMAVAEALSARPSNRA